MARLVRDVAHKSGKKVAFSMQGEDTELDRNVVEQISDPLVHMIRNAIDHGLETPEKRASVGKSVGELRLRAQLEGSQVKVTVSDDGAGIDLIALVEKAKSIRIGHIDYKDTATLRKFISERGKIRARRVTGLSVQEQRKVATAIKNAREVALLPYASTAR